MGTEPRGVPGRGDGGFLLATVFCSGAGVMVVEMTAVRALQPFFGSTTWVWTNVIGVVLAALSAGYAVGGWLADRHPSPRLLCGLLAAGGLLVATAAATATRAAGLFLDPHVLAPEYLSVLLRGSLFASLLLFAPATFVLGMVSPLAVRLLAAGGVGRAAGRVYAVSTVGSILGTYLPAFVLVPALGSRGTLLVAAAILVAPAAAGIVRFGRARGRAALAAAALLAALAAIATTTDRLPRRPPPLLPDEGEARILAEAESRYQYLCVRQDRYPGDAVEDILTANESLHTYHSYRVRGRILTGLPHHDTYSALPMLLDLPPGSELRMLMLGLAAGVDVLQWRHFWDGFYRLRVDGVEIDPEVVALGRKHFGLPPRDEPWLSVHEVDARQFLTAQPPGSRWHVIVVDAFANELSVPFHLATAEFFALCRAHLLPDGLLAMNVNARDEHSANLHAVENTLATVFGACLRVGRSGDGNYRLIAADWLPDTDRLLPFPVLSRFGRRPDVAEWQDLAALAAEMPALTTVVRPREDGRVLTDDHAPLEWLSDRFR